MGALQWGRKRRYSDEICIVALANPDLTDKMGVVYPPPTLAHGRVFGMARVRFVCIPRPGGLTSRDPCSPPSTRCPATIGQEAETDSCRQASLGVAVRILAQLAVCPHHRQAGDRDRLAPEGLSTFLDLESPSRPNRTAKRFERSP